MRPPNAQYKCFTCGKLTWTYDEEHHCRRKQKKEADPSELSTLKAKLEKAEQKIKELEAKLWVANDKSLRNYDGLAEKADKYDEAVKKIAALEFIVKQLKSDES